MTVDTLMNTNTQGNQSSPVITSLKDGGFVVVWVSSDSGSDSGIYAQRYDENGVAKGAEFRVNTSTFGSQDPLITALNDGGFVVSWTGVTLEEDFSLGIYARRYDADWIAQGDEFHVNTYTNDLQWKSSVTGLNNGGFVVTWTSVGQDGSDSGIYAQRYDADGVAIGSEFLVNTYTNANQMNPAIAALEDGGFVISWGSENQNNGDYGIYAQRYEANTEKQGDEFLVSPVADPSTNVRGIQNLPAIGTFRDGGFVISWESESTHDNSINIYAQRYDAEGVALGNEFLVNTYTIEDQSIPSIAVLKDGGFVVSWSSINQDGSGSGIYAQRYDVLGIAQGNEFLVNTFTTNDQSNPSIVALEDGGFVVSWESDDQDGDGTGIFGKRYDANGNILEWRKLDKLINTYTLGDQFSPNIATLKDGGYVIAWVSDAQDTSGSGIYAQRYDIDGLAQGSEFRVNTFTIDSQEDPSVTALTNGGFVITWSSREQDGSGFGIYAQRYDSNGVTQGSEFLINTHTNEHQWLPSIATLKKGGFVATWTSSDGDGTDVYAKLYDDNGIALVDEFLVHTSATGNQGVQSIAAMEDGGFVVAWESSKGIDGLLEIYARRFDATGIAQGNQFLVHSDSKWIGNKVLPSVASLKNGGFVVSWTSDGEDGSETGIYGKLYDADGSERSDSFLINTYTNSDQGYPVITALKNGDFVVSWMSLNQDGEYMGVYAQIFNAAGMAQGSEFLLNTFTAGNQAYPSITAHEDGGFIATWQSDNQDGNGIGIFGKRFDAKGNEVEWGIPDPSTLLSADRLYNWAESVYPDLFPDNPVSMEISGYYARIYENGNGLGEQSSNIYFYDGHSIALVGTIDDFLSGAIAAGF